MVPLFQALLDYDSSPEVYERYDRMSARDLFRQYGVSQRRALYPVRVLAQWRGKYSFEYVVLAAC